MANMKLIYVHLNLNDFDFSDELKSSNFVYSTPEYLQTSIDQSKKMLNINDIVVLTNTDIKKYNDSINEFYELCKQNMPDLYNDPFWLLTLLRLIVLNLYVTDNKIEKFIHMECDNLIYDDMQCLAKLPNGIYFTRVGSIYSSAGFVYCNSLRKINDFDKNIRKLIKKGQNTISKITGDSYISEMIMINLMSRGTKDVVSYLPIQPEDDFYDDLQLLFDGASYGQYIGGTNNGQPPGWAGNHHYIGALINSGQIKVMFDYDNKIPVVEKNNKQYKIGNLHIHSKQLSNYV